MDRLAFHHTSVTVDIGEDDRANCTLIVLIRPAEPDIQPGEHLK